MDTDVSEKLAASIFSVEVWHNLEVHNLNKHYHENLKMF
jgi:hypothetical protein